MDSSGQIVKLLETPGRYSYLYPSPDGRKLAFISGQDVWVLDMKRGRPSRVSFNTIDNQWPVWAPDSAHLVFSAQNRKRHRTIAVVASGGWRRRTAASLRKRRRTASIVRLARWHTRGRPSAQPRNPLRHLDAASRLHRSGAAEGRGTRGVSAHPGERMGRSVLTERAVGSVLLGRVGHGRDLRAAISRARWAVARLERRHRRDDWLTGPAAVERCTTSVRIDTSWR